MMMLANKAALNRPVLLTIRPARKLPIASPTTVASFIKEVMRFGFLGFFYALITAET